MGVNYLRPACQEDALDIADIIKSSDSVVAEVKIQTVLESARVKPRRGTHVRAWFAERGQRHNNKVCAVHLQCLCCMFNLGVVIFFFLCQFFRMEVSVG